MSLRLDTNVHDGERGWAAAPGRTVTVALYPSLAVMAAAVTPRTSPASPHNRHTSSCEASSLPPTRRQPAAWHRGSTLRSRGGQSLSSLWHLASILVVLQSVEGGRSTAMYVPFDASFLRGVRCHASCEPRIHRWRSHACQFVSISQRPVGSNLMGPAQSLQSAARRVDRRTGRTPDST